MKKENKKEVECRGCTTYAATDGEKCSCSPLTPYGELENRFRAALRYPVWAEYMSAAERIDSVCHFIQEENLLAYKRGQEDGYLVACNDFLKKYHSVKIKKM